MSEVLCVHTSLARLSPKSRTPSPPSLVRKQEQTYKYAAQGITASLLAGLEDQASVRQLASQSDVIVHTADSTNVTAAEAPIYCLRDGAQRMPQPRDHIAVIDAGEKTDVQICSIGLSEATEKYGGEDTGLTKVVFVSSSGDGVNIAEDRSRFPAKSPR
ncbi:hypothetical protein RRF57_009321 [Xylaria bambusicola]|uniref:Uncharacterized protein n=1 Tax=Xylaria bambusicola TaxID=326684 RepID=A0AAN7Z8W5_9PEZI